MRTDCLILPIELRAEFGLSQASPGTAQSACPYDPGFENTMRVVDDVVDAQKDALETLA